MAGKQPGPVSRPEPAKDRVTAPETDQTALPPDWLTSLEFLLAKYSGLGITPDLAALSVLELYGLYRFLQNLSGT